jgi:hypothetical protein
MLVSCAMRLFQGFIAPAVLFQATVLCYVRLWRSVVLNVDIIWILEFLSGLFCLFQKKNVPLQRIKLSYNIAYLLFT